MALMADLACKPNRLQLSCLLHLFFLLVVEGKKKGGGALNTIVQNRILVKNHHDSGRYICSYTLL